MATLDLSAFGAGTFTLDDDGIAGNGQSVVRNSSGTVIAVFTHPVDFLTIVSTNAQHLIFNITDPFGAIDVTVGSLSSATPNPASIQVQYIGATTGRVTLVANGAITERGSDAAPEIIAGSLILGAGTGLGTLANPIETRVAAVEAETASGDIALSNFGAVTIGGLTGLISGLDVTSSGSVLFTNVGTITLGDFTTITTIKAGDNSGDVTLVARGYDADVISSTNNNAAQAIAGHISITAGRDIGLGSAGTSNNDVYAGRSVTLNAGRDVIVSGGAEVRSNFLQADNGSGVTVTAGRNISVVSNIAANFAHIRAGGTGDVVLTAGANGTVTLGSGTVATLWSNFGDVVVNADRIVIGANSGIYADAGTVTLRPLTAGWDVNLGSATDAAIGTLELSRDELNSIVTPTLSVGSTSTGNVRVTDRVGPTVSQFEIVSGADIIAEAGSQLSSNDAVILRAADNVQLLYGSETFANTLSLFVDGPDSDPGVGAFGTVNEGVFAGSTTVNGNGDADTLTGNYDANTLNGLGGADTLRGFDGDDMLNGGTGADTMDGGLGNDIYFVDNAGDQLIEAAGGGYDTVFTEVSFTLALEVDRLVTLAPSATTALSLTGNALANEITGNAGANIIDGRGGADLMVGGNGDDIYFVDNAGDVVSDAPGGGFDTVFSSISFTLTTLIERVVANSTTATTALNFTGNASVNEITGNNGSNMIDGGGGADLLFGNGGSDAFLFTTALGGGNIDSLPDYQPGIDRFYLDDAVFTALAPGALPAGAFRIGSAAADADDRIIYNPVSGALLYDADGNGAGAAIQWAVVHEALAMSASDFQII